MCYPEAESRLRCQLEHFVLKLDTPRGVGSTRIHQQQNLVGIRIIVTPTVVPPQANTLGDESRSFRAGSEGDKSLVELEIVNAMGYDLSLRKMWEVVVEALQWHAILGIKLAVAVETPKKFLLFGVHTDHRPSLCFILCAHFFNVLELLVSKSWIHSAGHRRFDGLALANLFF